MKHYEHPSTPPARNPQRIGTENRKFLNLMVNWVILPPPRRPPPSPALSPEGIKCQSPPRVRHRDVPGLSPPGDVPGVPSLRMDVPKELGFPMETQRRGRGTPGTPGGLHQSLGCSPAVFGGIGAFWGGVHTTSAAPSAGGRGGQLGPTAPILALLAPGSPPCSWHPKPPPAIPGTQNTNVP